MNIIKYINHYNTEYLPFKMSTNQFITTVAIFHGNQGKYYIHDGFKYDIHFPLVWALDHHNYEPYYDEEKDKTYINGSGPNKCENCKAYGSMNGVFVGYCSTCLHHVYHGKRGEYSIFPGMSVSMLCECTLWKQYPYLNGVKISEIGDKIVEDEDTIIDYIFVEDEYLNEVSEEYEEEQDDEERMRIAHEEEFQRMCEEDDRERYEEERYEIYLEKIKGTCCRWD